MRRLWFFLWLSISFSNGADLASPDGKIGLQFDLAEIDGTAGCPVYRVSFRGQPLITDSRLGLELGNGVSLRGGFTEAGVEESAHDGTWKPVYGERSVVRDHYRQLKLRLVAEDSSGYELGITFRCYDSGVAFCYEVSRGGSDREIVVKQEHSEFAFRANHVAWSASSAQGEYRRVPLSRIGSGAERPLTIEVDENSYVALGEARLVDYARMKFRVNKGQHRVLSTIHGPVRATSPLTTPWRVIMVAGSPGELLENNDLFLNLNDPCAIEDSSWIKPGKVIREVTLTTSGAKACVDFAARRKLQYVEFDAGWYGAENDNASDASTVTLDPKRSRGPLDLPEVIRYAEGKGIGIILYVNRRALERQLDEILPLYQKWGIRGLKYGFVQVGSQQWTAWLHEAVRKAADHQLMVDVHDEYRPTGASRTFPNLMTQEGIRGDETKQSNRCSLTILFTRMLAGAGDNTICYYGPEVKVLRTHACQLAKAVCFYSPWQFLYWYDSPSRSGGRGGKIGDDPELEFYDHVPTVWDDTRVLHGRIGEVAVLARRSGEEWFVGAMNGEEARTLDVALDFLEPGMSYDAAVYSDDPGMETATQVRIEHRVVTRETVMQVKLLANGGQAMRIVPVGGKD